MDTPLVTGIGIVSPLGIGREAVAASLAEGRSGVSELTLFDPVGGCEHAAEVGDYDWQDSLSSVQTYADRATQLAMGAARMALEDAGFPVPLPEEAAPVGLAYGTCWGCLEAAETFYQPLAEGKGRTARSLVFSHSYPNSPTSLIAVELGLRGYSTSWAGAPAAGLWAVRSACDAIASGSATAVLAGGCDALSAARLASLAAEGRLPRTEGASHPSRASAEAPWGEVPGEAAVFWLLESPASAHERNARSLGTVSCPVAPGEAEPDKALPAPGCGRTAAAEALLRASAWWLGGEGGEITLGAGEPDAGPCLRLGRG